MVTKEDLFRLRTKLEACRRGVRIQRRAILRYQRTWIQMVALCSEFESSTEPRSYSHAYEALRSILMGLDQS